MKRLPYIDSKKKKILLAHSSGKQADSEALRSENEALKDIFKYLGVNEKRLQQLIQQKKTETAIVLPISIFRSRSSALEVIVMYLHDVKRMRFTDIAAALNRDHRTIWHAYRRSASKQTSLNVLDSDITSDITIPVSIFADRTYAPLEAGVTHLKDSCALTFSEIAELLERSSKTVWTVYQRAKKKHAQQ